MRRLAALALLAGCLGGCISAVPVEPVTPANQAQVTGCQSIASTHNDLVVGGFVFSGGATALGAISSVTSDASTRVGLSVATAIVGVLAGLDTAWAALTSSEFANGNCSAVVGPLPAGKRSASWLLDPPRNLDTTEVRVSR